MLNLLEKHYTLKYEINAVLSKMRKTLKTIILL